MSLPVGQLVYTSFPEVGFKTLASPDIPPDIQQVFLEQIVHEFWDAYNPPPTDYRAAYFYQVNEHQSLFGWLYNDLSDDLGRSHIPHFASYYWEGSLAIAHLDFILTCLEIGPITIIERLKRPTPLDKIIIPDFCNYPPARRGVRLSASVRKNSHHCLQQHQLLALFVPHETNESVNTLLQLPPEHSVQQLSPVILELPPTPTPPTITQSVEHLLQELMAKPIGIQGVVLVSPEGQLITAPMGMDENSALIAAGTMLYLGKNTIDELNLPEIEQISIRAQEGHMILTNLNFGAYLLVKAGKVLSGLLEGEINRCVKKLQEQLQSSGSATTVSDSLVPSVLATQPAIDEVIAEFSDAFDEIESAPDRSDDSEVRYRGRRTNL